ncbi:MAG: hypothetical protein ACM3JG_12920 [Thiohalocapsa sp.]
MPLELWILAGLGLAALAVAVARRVGWRAGRDRGEEAKNVYPLW